MFSFASLFDAYSLRARLLPALLLVLPPAIVCALLFPVLYATLAHAFGSLGVVAVAMFLLAHLIREQGRRLQQRLYIEWGGTPTTIWLRHRDNNIDPITKARYHRFLEARVSALQLPSPESEARDPAAADKAYDSAVKWLLEFTRNTKSFPLVFSENVYYGFRRNASAARPIALFLVVALALVTAFVSYSRYRTTSEAMGPDIIATWIVLLLCAVLWTFYVTEAWVKDGAFAYARALLAACEDTAAARRPKPSPARRRSRPDPQSTAAPK
jgi:hypothetical protein